MRIRLGRATRGILAIALVFSVVSPSPAARATGNTYFVDCASGNDAQPGTSTGQAWRSITRANQASLSPGERLLLKRGCTWNTGLNVKWSGTSSARVLIGAYGTGTRPLIQNAQSQLYITGSYVTVESLAARADAVTHDASCQNARAGRRIGFRLASGSAYNVLRDVYASDLFMGAQVDSGSHHNQIIDSTFVDNDMKSDVWTSDAGAVGIALLGDDNEVARNTIFGSDVCSRFYGRDGSAIEVYGGQRNRIHHNRAWENNNFSELGHARSADNTYAFNVVASSLDEGHFLTTRGSGDSKYGPVLRTTVTNNSVYLSGSSSFALLCSYGCNRSILKFVNNVIWAADRVGYADGAFDEGNNVYWSPGGPKMWFPYADSSFTADPRFVNAAGSDLRLQSNSPALDIATSLSLELGFTMDADGVALPQGRAVDAGAYERLVTSSGDPIVADSFTRTTTGRWGSAEVGGSYSYVGPWSDYDVRDGAGTMHLRRADVARAAELPSVSARDIDARFRVRTDRIAGGGGHYVYLLARKRPDGSSYRAKLRFAADRKVYVGLSKSLGTAESALVAERASTVGYAAGSYVWLRAQVTGAGPTMLRLKVWPHGQSEPTSWTLTAMDGTAALQSPGSVALLSYTKRDSGPVVLRFDDFTVTRL